MDMEHIDWRNSLLTSLYSQAEFLEAETKSQCEVIRVNKIVSN